jgi:hypothetical protein
MTPKDTRVCIACPTREARGKLLSALRALRTVRVSPMLDEAARINKRAALRLAYARGLRVADRGDYVGIWSPSGRMPANLYMIDVHLPYAEFCA